MASGGGTGGATASAGAWTVTGAGRRSQKYMFKLLTSVWCERTFKLVEMITRFH